jgi:hypothetical protein
MLGAGMTQVATAAALGVTIGSVRIANEFVGTNHRERVVS